MMKRLALLVFLPSCYFLMGEEIRQGIAATDEALREGKPHVAQAYIVPTREVAGEPKTIPPLNIGAAQFWATQVRAKAARLRASLGAFLSRFGLQATLGGGGIMAVLVGWVVKNKRTVKRLAGYIVDDGKRQLAGAKDEAAELKLMKDGQEKFGVRTIVQKELKT